MISIEEVLFYHHQLIRAFGGSAGVRDRNLLESAIYRPFQSFGGEDLYKSPIEKAAAIGESIIKNHPFIDGNKRTGYAMMRLILLDQGLDIEADEETKYQFVIEVSMGKLSFEEMCEWLKVRQKVS